MNTSSQRRCTAFVLPALSPGGSHSRIKLGRVLAAGLCSARSQRRIVDWASADAMLNRHVQRRRDFDWPWLWRVLAAIYSAARLRLHRGLRSCGLLAYADLDFHELVDASAGLEPQSAAP